MLLAAGTEVTGFALDPPTDPSLFKTLALDRDMRSVKGDIRDMEALSKAFAEAKPEIVFHLAAQPIVREGYKDPRRTYETNVMGTVNILECVRRNGCVRSFVNVTTDKVYENKEQDGGYRECDPLDGPDPYSNSKSCSELVTRCYKNSFFAQSETVISTARAGNVIGGGDFAPDRIIPDCVRAVWNKPPVVVRNPGSVRPYQHVLEPLDAYLLIAARQYDDPKFSGCYNIGPGGAGHITTGELADLFCRCWGQGAFRVDRPDAGPREASRLTLDCSKIRNTFGWTPLWDIGTAVEKTVDWYKAYLNGCDAKDAAQKQIMEYLKQRYEHV
jgi:CDP-glucose 4,6-dehydratase